MTLQINDHCHLSGANPPVTEYSVRDAAWDYTPNTAVTYERSITGLLHVHRLLTGSDPIQFEEDKITLICTLAEMLVVRALAGKLVYFVNNYHDDTAMGTWPTSAYITRGLLMIQQGAISSLGPMAEYWLINANIVDDSAVT